MPFPVALFLSVLLGVVVGPPLADAIGAFPAIVLGFVLGVILGEVSE